MSFSQSCASQQIIRTADFPPQNGAPTKNYWPIAVAIGVIVSLGSVFLFLAANQILPYKVNAISELGIWGQVSGYCGWGAGVIITSIGAIQWHLKNKMPVLNGESTMASTFAPLKKQSNCVYIVPDPLIPLIQNSVDVLPPANYFFWVWGATRKFMTTECKDFLDTHKISILPTVIVILNDSCEAPDGTSSKLFFQEHKEKYPHLNCVEFSCSFTKKLFNPKSELNQIEMEKLNQIAREWSGSL